ncbi:MAG: aspartate/glutamate racemase family protein [Micromonosporaceae bacterium]
MAIYTARPGQMAYGYPIGIICARWHIPFIPGDLNHAASYDYPVRYVAADVPGTAIVQGTADLEEFGRPIVAAARRLEAEGVRAITSNCGFFGRWQGMVADAVRVPVFMSSLIVAPFIRSLLGTDRAVGVLVANSKAVGPSLLGAVGIGDPSGLVIHGMEAYAHFNEVILEECGTLDSDRMRAEVVEACGDLLAQHPEVGALLLECSDLPVYAEAAHAATGLPVFDWVTLIDFVARSVTPKRYTGLY